MDVDNTQPEDWNTLVYSKVRDEQEFIITFDDAIKHALQVTNLDVNPFHTSFEEAIENSANFKNVVAEA